MKKWKQKVNIPNRGICDVIEHTDKECYRYDDSLRLGKDNDQRLAPYSHGFVCLYQHGKYIGWCGVFHAEDNRIFDMSKRADLKAYVDVQHKLLTAQLHATNRLKAEHKRALDYLKIRHQKEITRLARQCKKSVQKFTKA